MDATQQPQDDTVCCSVPLSAGQLGMWYAQELDPSSSAYNLAVTWRLRGELDDRLLMEVMQELVDRHQALRTRFSATDADPIALVAPSVRLSVPSVDMSHLDRADQMPHVAALVVSLQNRPFDLRLDPLIRLQLAKLGPEEHLLIRVTHHIVWDTWSSVVFQRDFQKLYHALRTGVPVSLPALTLQPTDLALIEQESAARGDFEEGVKHVAAQLSGSAANALPRERQRRLAQDETRGGVCRIELSRELTASLRTLSRTAHTTSAVCLLSAFLLLLHRWSGKSDVAVAVSAALRRRDNVAGLIGMLMNLIVVRADVSGASFLTLIARVETALTAARRYSDVPIDHAIRTLGLGERRESQRPVQVCFNMLNIPGYVADNVSIDLHTGDVERDDSLRYDPTDPLFDLMLVTSGSTRFVLALSFDRAMFSVDTAREMVSQLELLLRQLVLSPDVPITSCTLRTASAALVTPQLSRPVPELDVMAEWRLPDINAAGTRWADRIAAVEGDKHWTYRAIASASDRVDTWLTEHGFQGRLVAIYAKRGVDAIAALLGAWRAGCASAMLDAAYPAPRLLQFLRVSRPAACLDVVSGPRRGEPQVIKAMQALGIGAVATVTNGNVTTSSAVSPNPGSDHIHKAPGYVAFTSGSGGEPKAVCGGVRPVAHFIDWYVRAFNISSVDRVSMLSGIGHDPLLRDILAPLAVGATICIPDEATARGIGLPEWLNTSQVSIVHITPSLGKMLTSAEGPIIPALRLVCFGGEPLTPQDVLETSRVAPASTIVNAYGTTETPQIASYSVWLPGDPKTVDLTVSIGRGSPGVQLVLLGSTGESCGIGELGEICVRTPFLTSGYLNDPSLTANRYMANPATGDMRDTLFKTGDMGRYDYLGNVHYVGRSDRQVNVRGNRVEVAEIEACLRSQPGAADAVVTAAESVGGSTVLHAYVLVDARGTDPETLRAGLRRTLPRSMVPTLIRVVREWPLTPNRKIDRETLFATTEAPLRTPTAGVTKVEKTLCRIFSEVLGLEDVRVSDDFFDLGGHSVAVMQLINRVRSHLGVRMSLQCVFDRPTVAALAIFIEASMSD